MAKIVNTRNNGNPGIRTGEVMVNSKNVYPSTLVAVPSPGATTLTLSLLDGYDFFVGQNTSAATDLLVLPENAPVGTEIKIHATNSFGVIKSGSDTINGVSTIVTITAAGTATITKVSATKWILLNQATSGALTAPTT
jgi:hypothetical protein